MPTRMSLSRWAALNLILHIAQNLGSVLLQQLLDAVDVLVEIDLQVVQAILIYVGCLVVLDVANY